MILGIFDSLAHLLEVLGVWLAAIATFTAAYVALTVANRANTQNIRLVARPMLEVEIGGGSPKPIFHIVATNVGQRNVTITHLGARSAFKLNSFILTSPIGTGPQMPVNLADGEAAHWRFPEVSVEGKNWYAGFAKSLVKRNRLVSWFLLRTMRFLVVTSLGKTFYSDPSPEMRKKVTEQMKLVGAL